MLGLCCCEGFPLVVVSGRYSLVAVHGLLTVVASLVEEYGLYGMWASAVAARGLSGCGDWATGLSRSAVYGIFPDWELNPHLLHGQVDS